MRGPAVLPSELAPEPPLPRSRREQFDRIVLDIVTEIDDRWADRLGVVEYAVEDSPELPDDWGTGRVPLSSLIRGTGAEPTRLVIFRRPIEHRAPDRADLEALVLTVVVEQVAELLGIPAAEVDPRYTDED
ncbi:metallopeptidase family protein [Nocardioides sp. GY 10113]|nr:metallopeptidase family protein [Nocardioides sp. GY 10113]